MGCGAPIGAEQPRCGHCGTSFASDASRPQIAPQAAAPSAGAEDDPRTVVVYEVPDTAPVDHGSEPQKAWSSQRTLASRGTVPIHPDDLPRGPRRKPAVSMGTMILVDAAPANVATAQPARTIEPAPDSHTMVMAPPAAPVVRANPAPPTPGPNADESDDGPASLTRPGLEPFPHLAPKPAEPRDPRENPTVAMPTAANPSFAVEPQATPHRGPDATSAAPPAPHESYRPPSGAPLAEPDRPMPQHFSMPPAALLPEEALPSPARESQDEELAPPTTGFPPHGALPELQLPPMAQPAMVSPTDPMNGWPSGLRDATEARGEAAMSMVAGTAKIISEAFNMGFGSSIPGWRTEVAAPMGMSTEGGKQALLPITLVNDAGQRIAIGSVDAQQRRVTLKTHRTLSRGYAQRYNRGFDVSPEQHAAMLDSIQSFFRAMHFALVMDEEADEPALATTPATNEVSRRWWLVAAIAVVIVACVVWMALR